MTLFSMNVIIVVIAGVIVLVVVAISYFLRTLMPMGRFPFARKARAELNATIEQELTALEHVLGGLERSIARLETDPTIFSAKTISEVRDEQKQLILEEWGVFLDHQAALSRVVETYQYFYQISYWLERPLHAKAFLLGYGAFVTAYASGVRFIQLVQESPVFDLILNDALPANSIPARAYDALTERVIHFDGAARLAAGYQHYRFLTPFLQKAGVTAQHSVVCEAIEQAATLAADRLSKHAFRWFPKNSGRLLQKTALGAILPLQKSVATAMGHARVGSRKHFFITQTQIEEMRSHLEPGDVLLERRNWYLSNVGIPGFWPHAALYLGTYEECAAFFDTPEVRDYLATHGWQSVAEAFEAAHPTFQKIFQQNNREVLEAKAEGVLLTRLLESACADYVAAIRPNLSRLERFKALLIAVHHYGKPYDYSFDFVTDSALVCSELIYKTYKSFLPLPLTSFAGHLIVPATSFAQICDEDRLVPHPRFSCVFFLDASEKRGQAFVATEEAFCGTWKRPKWDLVQE